MNRITCLVHSVRLGQSWPPNVADAVIFSWLNDNGVLPVPYRSGEHSLYLSGVSEGFIQLLVQVLGLITY